MSLTELSRAVAGNSGRSSVTGITATVFGATGFLGRYIVNRLGRIGSRVVIPFRGDEHAIRHLKVLGDLGQIVPVRFDPRDPASIAASVARSNLVINLIGSSRATRNFSLDDVNIRIAEAVAKAAADTQGRVQRLVHVSALGADADSEVDFFRTKALGEQAVRAQYASATVVRPAVMFGVEDRFVNELARMPAVFGLVPTLTEGHHKIQPVWVGDVAQGIMHVAEDAGTAGKTYAFAGPEVMSRLRLAKNVLGMIERGRDTLVPLPDAVVDVAGKVLGAVHKVVPLGVPFVADEVRAMRTSVVQQQGELGLADVNVKAVPLEEVAVPYLQASFKKGGLFYDPDLAKE